MLQTREVEAGMALNLTPNFFTATDKMFLFKSTFHPTRNSTLADFTANKIAAADVLPVTMSGSWIGGIAPDQSASMIYGGLVQFTPVSGTVTYPVIAGGWYIANSGGTALLGSKEFDNPFTFNTDADVLLVKPSFTFPVDGESDDEFVAGP